MRINECVIVEYGILSFSHDTKFISISYCFSRQIQDPNIAFRENPNAMQDTKLIFVPKPYRQTFCTNFRSNVS